MLSKKDKEQLISIEKCERASVKDKLVQKLQEKKDAIEQPLTEKIRKLENEKTKALIDATLLYIDAGVAAGSILI